MDPPGRARAGRPISPDEHAEAPISTPSVARSTAGMSLATAASRVTGFARTWAMAVALGVTLTSKGAVPIASSYNIANNIPNMIFELVAGGILSSMFIPIFMELVRKEGDSRAWAFVRSVVNVSMVALGLVAIVGTFLPGVFVLTQTFTIPRQEAELAIYLFRFFAVQIVFYGGCAIATGVLNANRRFVAPMLAPLFNNIVVIVVLLGVYLPLRDTRPDLALIGLGAGTTLGVFTMLVVQLPALFKLGFRPGWGIDLKDPALRRMGVKMLPILGYVGANLVHVSFRNAFATSAFRDGSAVLAYAWMWYQLPYGIFAVSLTTALFPELSQHANDGDWDLFKKALTKGMRVLSLMMLPMAALLIALSGPLISLYRAGRFPASAVPLVASVMSVWALGLFSFAAYMLVLRAFYSMQDSRTPMITNFVMTVVLIAMYWGFTNWPGAGAYALVGIPAAEAIFYTLHTAVLLVILRRRIGSFDARALLRTGARVYDAAALGGIAAWIVVLVAAPLAKLPGGVLAQLALGGAVGIGASYGVLAALRMPEMGAVTAVLRRLFGRWVPTGAES